MAANLINTVLGIVLVYAAVLKPELVGHPLNLLVASLIIVGCAFWASGSDRMRWFSTTNMVVGALAIVFAAAQLFGALPALINFWGVFWIGLVVAVVALWAALYRPSSQPNPQFE